MVEVKVREIERIERDGYGYTPISYGDDEFEELDVEHHLKRYKALTQEILTKWDKSTNSDVLLYFEALRTLFEGIQVTSSADFVIFKFPKKDIKYFPSPETITRCRRMLNSKGIGLPTNPYVLEKRAKRQRAIRRYFKNETKQYK